MDAHGNPGPVATAYAERRRALEEATLAPEAARSWPAVRRTPEEDCGLRSPLQRDRDRIVHCKAFRRLKHKTQVFVAPEGDHYRTRLTHTLEVTQIARTVARALRLNEDLTEAIGLGHDLGHPPFGHIGEGVLDACVQERYGARVPPLRALAARRRGARARRRRAQPHRRRARRDPLPLRPRADAAHARGPDRADRRPRRLHQPRHRRRRARRRHRRERPARRARSRCSARPGSARIDALVHDLVEHSAPAGDIVQGERGRRRDGRAAHVDVRQRLPRAGRAHRARADRARPAHALRPLRGRSRPAARRRRRARTPTRAGGSPTTWPG